MSGVGPAAHKSHQGLGGGWATRWVAKAEVSSIAAGLTCDRLLLAMLSWQGHQAMLGALSPAPVTPRAHAPAFIH